MSANEPGQPPQVRYAESPSRDLRVPGIALAVGAHPDDVEFGCGGVLAKWAAAGCTVHHLVCTDGSKGTWNPDADIDELVARRQAEQQEAARRLSGAHVGETIFLGEVDGGLSNTVELQRQVVGAIRRLQPDVVLTHDPWKRYRLHPDHRNAGMLVCDAVVAARDPHFFPDHGGTPHRPDALLLWEADEPDHVEDVSEFVETKLHALLAHESQFESTMGARTGEELDDFARRIRDRLSGLGAPFGVAAAEVFVAIRDL